MKVSPGKKNPAACAGHEKVVGAVRRGESISGQKPSHLIYGIVSFHVV
jgi:hypothetical protein